MEPGPHADLLAEAVRADGEAWRALVEGDRARARERLLAAAALYRRSFELAPPRSYGRLAAELKSATIAGEGAEAARHAREVLGDACDSPTSCYALAVAALHEGDDDLARSAAEQMRSGDAAFGRAADAIAAIAEGDREAYGAAVGAIVADFAERADHLTGVAIADTALLMEALAEPRGLAARSPSPLVPALP